MNTFPFDTAVTWSFLLHRKYNATFTTLRTAFIFLCFIAFFQQQQRVVNFNIFLFGRNAVKLHIYFLFAFTFYVQSRLSTISIECQPIQLFRPFPPFFVHFFLFFYGVLSVTAVELGVLRSVKGSSLYKWISCYSAHTHTRNEWMKIASNKEQLQNRNRFMQKLIAP